MRGPKPQPSLVHMHMFKGPELLDGNILSLHYSVFLSNEKILVMFVILQKTVCIMLVDNIYISDNKPAALNG